MEKLYKGFAYFGEDEEGKYGVTIHNSRETKYYLGKPVNADRTVPAQLCTAGVLHACRRPEQVLQFYSAHAYAEVEGAVVAEQDDKVGCRSLTVTRFLTLEEFLDSIKESISENCSPTSGDHSPTSGHCSPTSGSYSPTCGERSPTSGSYSPTSGYRSPTSGNCSPSCGEASPTCGDFSPTSGNRSPTSGDYSDASGGPVSAAIGRRSKVKAPEIGMALMCAEWDRDIIISVASGMIDGEKIKPDTWYVCRNGELVEWVNEVK